MDVAVFVIDGVADFGYSAVIETFNTANALREDLATRQPMQVPPDPWTVRTVSLGESVRSSNGHTLSTVPLSHLPSTVGLMIVPAVNVEAAEALIEMVSAPTSQRALDTISAAHQSGAHVAAACTSTFFLAEAGVLNGSPATTSWWLGPAFRRRYPKVDLDESRALCRGDRVTTAGASLSHIDLALAVVHAKSPALAELAMRYMAVGNRPPQSAFAIPEVLAKGNSLVAAFERWVRNHLTEPFRISSAAKDLGVTERSLQRATHSELGMSPSDFADDIRVERASHLLRTTTLTVEAVAAKVGYLNGRTLRNLIRRRRGLSLAEIRSAPLSW